MEKVRSYCLALRVAACGLVALIGCSSGVGAEEPVVGASAAPLSFPSGTNAGYCASNPSPNCAHGTPLGPKQLALTFDDGPGSRTLELSGYLKSRGIRATFFINSAHVGAGAEAVLAQMVADGHLIGNHTRDHADLTTLGDAEMIDQLAKTDAVIAPFVPSGHLVFRAPFGAWNARVHDVLHASAMDKYVGPVSWDVGGETTARYAADWDCWDDAGGRGALTTKQCGDRYLSEITDIGRGIVLLHDQDYGDAANHALTTGRGNTVDMVKYLVEGSAAHGVAGLEARGYTFVRLDDVPDIKAALPPDNPGGGCAPTCSARACGDDGCGGSCGACAAGETCAGGACVGDGGACWKPTWAQTADANEWWVEYAISDAAVTSASLEIVGGRTVPLSYEWGAWVGPTGARVPAGTQVVVHAKGAAAENAKTAPFGYLVTTRPVTSCADVCVPSCAGRACGDDGCGGSCGACAGGATCASGACTGGACFRPTVRQTSDANEWWAEYAISDATVTSAFLEVVGGRSVPLSYEWGAWVGPTGQRIRAGTSVVVHARNAASEVTRTLPFGYLTVRAPKTECAP